MSRTIPVQLLTHLQSGATTTALLFKVTPKHAGLPILGFCNIDIPLEYDDGTGDGVVTYLPSQGTDTSALLSYADGSVDNAEAAGIFLEDGSGLSELDIRAGDYNYAGFSMMLINYEDPTTGRHVEINSGSIGEIHSIDGASFRAELRALMDKLRQTVVSLTSVTCRADFGSLPPTREPCNVDAEALFITVTVTAALGEPRYGFVATALNQADGTFRRGKVRCLTGANAGREIEVEDSFSNGTVTFRFPMDRGIAPGDQLKIRIGCGKRFIEDCIGVHNNRMHFRGEPFLPLADADGIRVPGVATGVGVGGGVVADVETAPV